MNIIAKVLFAAVIGVVGGVAVAETPNQVKYKNVVIGEGCASTCVDGVCEKVCKGDDAGVITRTGQASSNATSNARRYGFEDFNNLEITGFDAVIEYAEEFSVSAQSNTDNLERLNVELLVGVAGVATLKVSVVGDVSLGGAITIRTPDLQSITVSGDADVSISGFVQDQVLISAFENADVTFKDNAFGALILTVSGNADVSLVKSKVTTAEVSLDGNSNAGLNFVDSGGELTGSVTGSADLEYCGNPERRISVAGMADSNQVECD